MTKAQMEQFKWVLINFPDSLSEKQDNSLRELKIVFSRFCIKAQGYYSRPLQITIMSSLPEISNRFHLNFQIPNRQNSRWGNNNQELDKLVKELNGIDKMVKEDLGIVEIRIEERFYDGEKSSARVKKEHDSEMNLRTTSPRWKFQDIILPRDVFNNLERVLAFIENSDKIFKDWGLEKIYPSPKTIVSLSGPPGTGKTMTAHAIAHRLDCKIIEISYAQIESKYVGEGPKNLRKVFEQGKNEGALLFFDEADSLLGKRITNVTDGSDQAINSMRSQMLIEIDRFVGIAVFATNLVENYDFGFDSRLIHVPYTLPDKVARSELLNLYLVDNLPGKKGVNIEEIVTLSEGMSGRDLRDVVLYAAAEMARHSSEDLHHSMLVAIEFVKNSRNIKNLMTQQVLTKSGKIAV